MLLFSTSTKSEFIMKHTAITHRFAAAGRHQRGASLLEIIAFLGIAAMVIIGAVSMINVSFTSAQGARLMEEALGIRTGVKKLYMTQSTGYGTAVINDVLRDAKVLPATISVSAGVAAAAEIKNNFGGATTITGATGQFTIEYTLVPQDTCVSALSGVSGWSAISVKGSAEVAFTTFPITNKDAIAKCDAATNTITFTSL